MDTQTQLNQNDVSLKPSETCKRIIALAVQQAVREVTQSGGQHKCQLEASAAAIVASALTDNPYEFISARIPILIQSSSSGHRWWRYPTPSWPWDQRPKVHCDHVSSEEWIIEHCFATGQGEILDFSSWQYRDYFINKYNVLWPFAPEYVWGPIQDIPRVYKEWYSTHPRFNSSDDIRLEIQQQHRETVKAITIRSLEIATQQGVPQAGSLVWPEWLERKSASHSI